MKNIFFIATLILLVSSSLFGCQVSSTPLRQQEALDIAWETLEPNTVSHNRDYWEIHDARKVYGKDVVKEFTARHPVRCPGPNLPENMPIKISSQYWYIKVAPHPEVRVKTQVANEPKYIQVVPEPDIVDATFLIDIYNGDVIARTLTCQ
jgi:hypothetical protein